MENHYQDKNFALAYLDFLASKNGQIQQEHLSSNILSRLPQNQTAHILDAACGSGWLSGIVSEKFPNTFGCDSSQALLGYARAKFPGVKFEAADLANNLPYNNDFFDVIILNMAGPDLPDLRKAFQNLARYLKPKGKLLATIPHPKYTFPAAVWKRSLWKIITGQKPELVFKPAPAQGSSILRKFGQTKIPSFYWREKDYAAAAENSNLNLSFRMEITSPQDSKDFDLNYQLHRFPLLLMLEFEKQA